MLGLLQGALEENPWEEGSPPGLEPGPPRALDDSAVRPGSLCAGTVQAEPRSEPTSVTFWEPRGKDWVELVAFDYHHQGRFKRPIFWTTSAVPKPMFVSKFAVVIRRSTKYAYCLFVLQIVLRTRPALRQTPVYRTLADSCVHVVSAASCVARLTASTRAPSSALVEFIGFAKR